MPVILNQHFLASDRPYEDAEFSLYHFPKVYFGRVRPYDRFIYYRPLGESKARIDSKRYFGHGVFGQWYPDFRRSDHRFVDLVKAEQFPIPVPLVDPFGNYYETEAPNAPVAQASVREISETAYYRILSAAGVSSNSISFMPSTEELVDVPLPLAAGSIPRDRFREIVTIPPGAGYQPSGDAILNVFESAALQERARSDHQDVLASIQSAILKRGGTTWYNNNVDLFARIGEHRFLIEAKSLNDVRDAVNRVRYGIGQLADYEFRYGEEMQGPQKVLAFGARPPREAAWLQGVLDQERTAFLVASGGVIAPLNETARKLPFLHD